MPIRDMPILGRRDIAFLTFAALLGLGLGYLTTQGHINADGAVPTLVWLLIGLLAFELAGSFIAAVPVQHFVPMVIRIAGFVGSFILYLAVVSLSGTM
jgi:hypothetical protein